jgi:thioredoxin 1
MLYTNLKHIETADEHAKIINENENVVVVCGRMGPCVRLYIIMPKYCRVNIRISAFMMEFDNPEAYVIRDFTEVQGFRGIPSRSIIKRVK